MTCIVALKNLEDGTLCMGADSCASDGWNIDVRTDPKLFRDGSYVIGFTSSYRMGQLIQHEMMRVRPPEDPDKLHRFMVRTFVSELRRTLKDGGYVKIENSREESGQFLVGVYDRIFMIDNDFQVAESSRDYSVVGSGACFAKGALAAISDRTATWGVESVVVTALDIAARHTTTVQPPFHVIKWKPE